MSTHGCDSSSAAFRAFWKSRSYASTLIRAARCGWNAGFRSDFRDPLKVMDQSAAYGPDGSERPGAVEAYMDARSNGAHAYELRVKARSAAEKARKKRIDTPAAANATKKEAARQEQTRREAERFYTQQKAEKDRREHEEMVRNAKNQIYAIAEADERSNTALDPPGEHGAIRRLGGISLIHEDILAVGGMPAAVRFYMSERRRVKRSVREEKIYMGRMVR